MLTDAMSEPVQSRSLPQFDRPLRRMVWVVPTSLCLWIPILAGFALLLGNPASGPSVPPLEVSLADLGHGAAGGSPGGGPGALAGGGGRGIKGVRAFLPAARAVAPEYSGPSGRAMREQRPVTVAAKPHRRPAPKLAEIKDEDADTTLVRPARGGAEEQVDAGQTAARPRRRKHEPDAVPVTSLVGGQGRPPYWRAAQSKPAEQMSSATSSLGGASAAAGSGGGGGVGSGSGGSAGEGSVGRGGGTGGGIGDGSQAYSTVEHPPIPISRVLPVYPSAARAQGVEGEVVLRAIVDQRGAVERDIVVVESVPVLDRAAVEALRQWRFEPGRDAGNRAVPAVIEVPLRFRLR
jgi:periplasmic protein TonB